MVARKPAVVMTIRVDPDALAVLEWHARITGVPLRSTVRQYLEREAERISVEMDLPPGPPPPPSLGRFAPDPEGF